MASAGGDQCPSGQASGGGILDAMALLVQNDGVDAVDVTVGSDPAFTVPPCGVGVVAVTRGVGPPPGLISISYDQVIGVKVAAVRLD